jgi:hypothetical protein
MRRDEITRRDLSLFQRTGAIEEHRKMRNYLRRMEREGVQRVKMFLVITAAYVIFWGPLFFVTLVHHPVIGNPTGYEVIATDGPLPRDNRDSVLALNPALMRRSRATRMGFIDIYAARDRSRYCTLPSCDLRSVKCHVAYTSRECTDSLLQSIFEDG